MPKTTKIRGIKDRLREAETAEEITTLLQEGDAFENASEATRNAWRRQAGKRQKELGQ